MKPTPISQCISYPKSGRSWLRRMLEVAGCGDALAFHHDGFEFNDGARPPHDFDTINRLERYPEGLKLIYLERDPRDVTVSLFYQVTGRFRDFFGYTDALSDFIRDPYFGAPVLARFREIWAVICAERPFLTVRYEDMQRDAGRELERVMSYLGVDVTSERLAQAVEAGRFDVMRELEQSGAHPEPWLRPRHGFPKVRRGEVGAFRSELPADDIAYLNAVFGFTY